MKNYFTIPIDKKVEKCKNIDKKIKGGFFMYNYGYSSSSLDLDSLGFATLGAMLGVYVVIILAVAVLQIIAMLKIFTKAR